MAEGLEDYETLVEWYEHEKADELGGKPILVLTSPPQISHELA